MNIGGRGLGQPGQPSGGIGTSGIGTNTGLGGLGLGSTVNRFQFPVSGTQQPGSTTLGFQTGSQTSQTGQTSIGIGQQTQTSGMTAGINLAGQTPGLRLGMSTSLPVGVPGLGGSPRLQMVSPQQQQQQQVRILQQQQQQQQQPSHFTLQQQATSQTGLTVGITQPNSTAGTSVLGGGGLTGLGRGTIGGVQNLGIGGTLNLGGFQQQTTQQQQTSIHVGGGGGGGIVPGLKPGSLGTPNTGMRVTQPLQLNLTTTTTNQAGLTGLLGTTKPGQIPVTTTVSTGPTGPQLTGGLTGLQTTRPQVQQGVGITGLTGQSGATVTWLPGLPGPTNQGTVTGLSGTTGTGLPIGGVMSTRSGMPSLTGLTSSTTQAGITGFSKPGTLPTTTLGGGGVGGTTGGTGIGGGVGGTVGAPPSVKKYTYKELEDLVNKWSRELQDQEKVFMQQSQLVGQWDTMLQCNSEKIITLHEEVERVKNEQQKLDNELDLIGTQQQELEEVLSQIETSLTQQPSLLNPQHPDIERSHTYGMVERIDSQLRRMGQDLKNVIEQMNSAASAQEENDETTKIVKILNAHTDTLNWIDRNTARVQQKMEEVSSLTEKHRLEHERSFHLAFGQ